MVLLSSITSTFRPWSLVLLPLTFSELLPNCPAGPCCAAQPRACASRVLARGELRRHARDWRRDTGAAHAFHTSRLVSRACQPKGKREGGFNISVYPRLCHARHVFRSSRRTRRRRLFRGRHIRAGLSIIGAL